MTEKFSSIVSRLQVVITKLQKRVDGDNKDWLKYRLALLRIAHPKTYQTERYDPREIARRALVIGMDIDPLPDLTKAHIEIKPLKAKKK